MHLQQVLVTGVLCGLLALGLHDYSSVNIVTNDLLQTVICHVDHVRRGWVCGGRVLVQLLSPVLSTWQLCHSCYSSSSGCVCAPVRLLRAGTSGQAQTADACDVVSGCVMWCHVMLHMQKHTPAGAPAFRSCANVLESTNGTFSCIACLSRFVYGLV